MSDNVISMDPRIGISITDDKQILLKILWRNREWSNTLSELMLTTIEGSDTPFTDAHLAKEDMLAIANRLEFFAQHFGDNP